MTGAWAGAGCGGRGLMAGLRVGLACGVLLLPGFEVSSSSPQVPGHPTSICDAIPSPFYEARFGVEIFAELYDSTLSSPVSSYILKRYITFYFVDFAVIVYCYYGYLPILQHI